jgi:Zn-dependent protease
MQGLDLPRLAGALAFVLIPMILSLSVHECAHAAVAYMLGDRTAKDAGRLTLNPQAHLDPWGTVFVPAMGVLMGGVPFLGWGKPTPFRPVLFRDGVPRRLGTVLVAAAGPLANVILALLSISLLALLDRRGVELLTLVQDGDALVPRPTSLYVFLLTMFQLNLGLAFFHLLPVPPLDGYHLLPRALEAWVRPLERYGFAIIMVAVLMLPREVTGVVFRPVMLLMGRVEALFGLA